MNRILQLLSDTVPMSYPEIAVRLTQPERSHLEVDLHLLMGEGKVVHHRRPFGGVTISTFQLPEGTHTQRTIFDIA